MSLVQTFADVVGIDLGLIRSARSGHSDERHQNVAAQPGGVDEFAERGVARELANDSASIVVL